MYLPNFRRAVEKIKILSICMTDVSNFDAINQYVVDLKESRVRASKLKTKYKGILYVAPFGTSGYSRAAKYYIYDFVANKKIPVKYEPIFWETVDASSLTDVTPEDRILSSALSINNIDYDTVILHCTPENWKPLIKKYNVKDKYIIGQTVWETDKIDDRWIEPLNFVDEVWVPCRWNRQVFKNCGVTTPITIVPHVYNLIELPNKAAAKIRDYNIEKTRFTFYNISDLTTRKGIDDLLHAYFQTFTEKDNVQLILKTHQHTNYSEESIQVCNNYISKIVNLYKSPAKVIYIKERLTDEEILHLHSIGDCYVSLCKSEGWGLGAFEAHHYKKPVIITGYGGHLDFLGKDYPYLVDYVMVPVRGMPWIPWYNETQKWAQPDISHAISLMRDIYKLYGKTKNRKR
jgi:glycosyltransferase involved in cell wall biosynthesis